MNAPVLGLLTKRQRAILEQMRAHKNDDEGEIVYERGVAFLGTQRIAARTVNSLVALMAIRLEQDSTLGRFERYRINETGEALLNDQQPMKSTPCPNCRGRGYVLIGTRRSDGRPGRDKKRECPICAGTKVVP